jgi:hypothetical protein
MNLGIIVDYDRLELDWLSLRITVKRNNIKVAVLDCGFLVGAQQQ